MLQDTVIEKRFALTKKIYESPKHQIFKGIDLQKNEKTVVKIQKSPNCSVLLEEIQVMNKLYGKVGFCDLISSGSYFNRDYLILEYTSKSLSQQLKKYKRLSQGCIYRIGEELLNQIESLHKIGVIHGNLNLKHILCGYGRNWQNLYLVDFSNCFLTTHFKTGDQSQKHGKFLSKTLKGKISFKDDLEMILDILKCLWKGTLPCSTQGKSLKNEKIHKKENLSAEESTQDCPQQFRQYLLYCEALKENEIPNYDFLRASIKNEARKNNIIRHFDWFWHVEKFSRKIKFSRNKNKKNLKEALVKNNDFQTNIKYNQNPIKSLEINHGVEENKNDLNEIRRNSEFIRFDDFNFERRSNSPNKINDRMQFNINNLKVSRRRSALIEHVML